MLITQEIYDARSRTVKFVPVMLTAGQERFIPEPLRPHTYYELTSEERYQALYQFLLGQAGVEPGRLGKIKPISKQIAQPMTFDAALSPGEDTLRKGVPLRLPAHPLEQADSRTLPLDVSSAWGLDRSSFLGLIAGRTDDGIFASLLRTEVALWQSLRKTPGRPALPVRWWLRINSGLPAPETMDQVWDAVEERKNDRLVSRLVNSLAFWRKI